MRGERQVGADGNGLTVCIVGAARVLPAGKFITLTFEGVHAQRLHRTVGEALGIHGPRPAVGQEGDGVDVGHPLGIKIQIFRDVHQRPVIIELSGAIGSGVPAVEAVSFAREAVCVELRKSRGIGHHLIRHGSRPAVGVEADGVVHRGPLGIQRHVSGKRDRRLIGIFITAAVRGTVPAAERVMRAAELVRTQL